MDTYYSKFINERMIEFKPTFLYIKRHKVTGLQYFGKTIKPNPEKYYGSGLYWRRHLKLYGNDIEVVWCQLFEDMEECINYAIKFSIENNIVESTEWANLQIENGIDGGNSKPRQFATRLNSKGKNKSAESIMKREATKKANGNSGATGRIVSNETGVKISVANKGRKLTTKQKENLSLILSNKPKLKNTVCPHCDKVGEPGSMSRWHMDNCKHKKVR